jgi:hypothetical protein
MPCCAIRAVALIQACFSIPAHEFDLKLIFEHAMGYEDAWSWQYV